MGQQSILNDLVNLKHTHIFVVGDVILDVYIEGQVGRISPEAPVPVLLASERRSVAGGAANVAANIVATGAHVSLCGRLGNDSEGVEFRQILKEKGVDIQPLWTSQNLPTITKTRLMSGRAGSVGAQQLVRLDREVFQPLQEAEMLQILSSYKEFLKKHPHGRALVLSDYGKGILTHSLVEQLIKLSKEQGVPIITDPKTLDVGRYQGSTVIKPNLSESRALYKATKGEPFGFPSFEAELQALADHYISLSGAQAVVMSLSEHGVLAQGPLLQGASVRFATKALQVADVSGAGDTLIAFLAMGLAASLPFPRVVELGNLAAGLVCGKLGTATVSPVEILESFQKASEATHPEKIIDASTMASICKDFTTQKRRVVFTNGCFDILHAGHVDYLQKAKAQGDILVIGLNTDSSVQRLKGPQRPLQCQEDRAQVLAGLACVDYIVTFDEEIPLNLILALKPHILVKGADYTVENTVGAQEVLGWGGKVVHIPLVPGRSTTSIVEKIKRQN